MEVNLIFVQSLRGPDVRLHLFLLFPQSFSNAGLPLRGHRNHKTLFSRGHSKSCLVTKLCVQLLVKYIVSETRVNPLTIEMIVLNMYDDQFMVLRLSALWSNIGKREIKEEIGFVTLFSKKCLIPNITSEAYIKIYTIIN